MAEYHPQGIQNLIYAFTRSVSNDILKNPPGSTERKHAEKLLKSAYFENLTGIDGEYLLERLLAKYEERQRKPNRRTAKQEYSLEYYYMKKREAEELKRANE
jgi:hypothetical protein